MASDFDVIVVGGGAAGMSAAIEAADKGARVLLVEARPKLGGSTSLSGGAFYAAGTSVQKECGITDTPDEMFRYYMVLNQYRVEPHLVRVLCDRAADALEWLIGFGAQFPAERLYKSGVDGTLRGHREVDQGAGIAAALDAAVSRRRIDIVYKTRARSLLLDSDGAVAGLKLEDGTVTAPTVVLATGGFGNNQRLLAELYPEAARAADWAWYIGVEECRGDGIEMGREIGADITGQGRGLLLLTPGFTHDVESYQPSWLAYVSRLGRRFIDETTEYAVVSGVVNALPNGECFAIFDEAGRLAAKPPPPTVKNPFSNPQWEAERLKQLADTGRIVRAETIEQLAERAGIEGGALRATLERYNADCDRGEDTLFFKAPAHLRKISQGPFYAVRLRPAIVALTSAGLRIDEKARVLTRQNRPIAGLYAAGETTGGVLGERYVGGGNSIANAVVFGRIAGVEASDYASTARRDS